MLRGARIATLATTSLAVMAGCALVTGVGDLAIADSAQATQVEPAEDGGDVIVETPTVEVDADRPAIEAGSDARVEAGPEPEPEPEPCVLMSTSPRTPTTVATSGGGNDWESTANVTAQDDVGATAKGCCSGDDSKTLLMTGFGFAIPDSAEIRGVTVAIRAKANTAASDKQVRLAVAGAAAGDDLKNASYTTAWVTRSYGDATNKWGLALTPAVVNAADFGLALRTHKPAFRQDTAGIDVVTIQVHYCAY